MTQHDGLRKGVGVRRGCTHRLVERDLKKRSDAVHCTMEVHMLGKYLN